MIKIYRWYHDDCVIGRLTCKDFQCFTLELPWKNNQKSISCIPEGIYQFHRRLSRKNGHVLELLDTLHRTHIQIHSGNYTYQIEGCVLVGDSVRWLDGDAIPDVTNSKKTLERLMEVSQGIDLIEIHNGNS